MDVLAESLDMLSLATKAVNALRSLLANLNIPLPAVLAQVLALVILLLVAVSLMRVPPDSTPPVRLGRRIGALAAAMAVLAILSAWIDALVEPPSRQLVGEITGAAIAEVRIELMDYRGEALATTSIDRDTDHGLFSISYVPAFADPPSAVVVTGAGCQRKSVPLRRPHLKQGAPVRFECGTGQ